MVQVTRKSFQGVLVVALIAAGVFVAAEQLNDSLHPDKEAAADRMRTTVHTAAPPLVFEENRGQDDPASLFLSRFGSYTVQFRTDEVRLTPALVKY